MLVLGQVNFSHASGADLLEDLVAIDRLPYQRFSLIVCKQVGHHFKGGQLDEILRPFVRRK